MQQLNKQLTIKNRMEVNNPIYVLLVFEITSLVKIDLAFSTHCILIDAIDYLVSSVYMIGIFLLICVL